jgi:epoxyqueuosine reductase
VGVTTSSLQVAALELGIAALGVCPAEPYVGTEADIARRGAAGLFADLKFTMARPEVSCHPETLVEGARSVISAALCYWRPEPPDQDRPPAGRIARYTRWDAYDALRERLDTLAAHLRSAGHQARVLVDANHHVDREAAARSGVGFYGKHTNLITRRHGSWVVLGTIATSAYLESTAPVRPGCGSCTACIDACPTHAIVEPGVLDTRECITYWTQSRHEVPNHIRTNMADMVYGCDICQQVCPWNRGVERRLANLPPVDSGVSLEEWLTAPDDVLDERYWRFFIPRRQIRFLRRNALIALASKPAAEATALATPFLESEDAMLREQARWTLDKVAAPS